MSTRRSPELLVGTFRMHSRQVAPHLAVQDRPVHILPALRYTSAPGGNDTCQTAPLERHLMCND
eukprot:414864-Alexandrium_andersonii.AAC.1